MASASLGSHVRAVRAALTSTQLALAETLLGVCEIRKGRIMFAYNFRENLAADRRFFDATDTLFGHPTQHELEEDEDIWLFEYRPSTRC